jgi:hypothetical protein
MRRDNSNNNAESDVPASYWYHSERIPPRHFIIIRCRKCLPILSACQKLTCAVVAAYRLINRMAQQSILWLR